MSALVYWQAQVKIDAFPSSMDDIQSCQYWWTHCGPHMHPIASLATHADNVKKISTCNKNALSAITCLIGYSFVTASTQ